MGEAGESNPWVDDVRRSKRRWRASSAALVAGVFAVGVLWTFKALGGAIEEALSAAVSHLPDAWPDIVTFGALQCLIFGLFFIAAILATRLDHRRLWRVGTGGPIPLVAGLVVGAGGFLAAVAVAAAAGAIATGAAPAASPPSGAIVFGLVVVAIQSISEEAFFRGWLQPILCADWGVRVGLLVTSAMFGGLHIIAGAHGPLAVVNLFLGGLLFGLLALRTGSLVVPAAAHFAWNWTESGVLGLAEDPSGSLINLKLTGQPLWNGGADTMNGSLATSLVLTALVVAAFLWKSAPRAV